MICFLPIQCFANSQEAPRTTTKGASRTNDAKKCDNPIAVTVPESAKPRKKRNRKKARKPAVVPETQPQSSDTGDSKPASKKQERAALSYSHVVKPVGERTPEPSEVSSSAASTSGAEAQSKVLRTHLMTTSDEDEDDYDPNYDEPDWGGVQDRRSEFYY